MKRRQSILTIFLLLSVAPVVCLQADEVSALRAGAAVVDISPETLPALRNGGFLQATSNRVDDRLHARCLVMSDGKETIAIVIVDSCMFPRTLCDEIKRLATKQTGIPSNRILISATHTHSAPSAMICLGCGPDEAYVKYVPARVAQSIADAHKNLQPAKLGWAVVDGADLTNCRRWITRSDRMGSDPFGGRTVRAMMHPGYQNANYTSPAGPIDPWLSMLSVVSAKDETPICLMANLSMHYFGGGGFSADYYGDVARLLEARIGKLSGKATPGFVGIMSQGTSGDLHWMDYSKPRRGVSRQQYAQRVTDRVLQAWKTIEHRSNQSIAMAEKRLTIARRTPSQARREWARPINAARLDRPPRSRVEVYAQHAEWIHENPKEEVVLQAVRIGELGITAIPNEVYGITGLKLKRQSPLALTFNLELANGAAGYIPPPEQHRLGGYTTWPARSAGLEEQAEPLIVETLLGLLETVAEKKRRALVDPSSTYSQAVTSKKPIAYWRLDDMDSTQVLDAMGSNHANYQGAVALFLPGANGSGFKSADYGSRAVYLAGGYVEASLDQLQGDYSVTMWFYNALPTDARDVTGVALSTEAETLLIAGKAAGDQSGKLVLKAGEKSFAGKSRITSKHWHHLTITRDKQHVRVYLDGSKDPEIDAKLDPPKSVKRLLIGGDGKGGTTFDGNIDEVAVFDRALTAGDIEDLYAKSGITAPPRPKPTIVLGPKPSDAESRKRYAEVVLASKPVAFWRLHDKSNQAAQDSAGKLSAQYETGSAPLQQDTTKENFSGGRVKARVPKLGNTYSVEMWVRNETPVHSRPVTGYMFSRGVDGVDGADGDNLGIGGTHIAQRKLFVFNGNQRDQVVAGRTRIERGSWSHVVMVRQDKRITVYLNGDPKPEIASDLPIGYPAGCEDVLLGGRSDNFANLRGMLEEVALYDRALTPQEVKAHFDAAGAKRVVKQAKAQPAPPSKPTPTDVGEALKTIHVREGYEVQLVAAEPLVKDPVAIDWGPDGKLWVVEMADYPSGIDGKGKPGGRVRFLEDTNNDGKYDKSTLFAEGLSFPNGVLVWGDGILVTAAPEILYLEDGSGDGKADVRRVMYSGYLEGNQQLRVNGLRWGLDNWVYCASGSHHGGYGKNNQITSLLTGKKYAIGSRDFRIRPDTGAIDPQSGPSQYGRNRDDWGSWFGVQNSHPLWHYVLADHHIRRNPHFAPPNPKHQVVTPTNPKVYPASTAQKRYHSFTQAGRFTSACSAMIYRDNVLFDRSAEQHAFTCEPFHNLVQHNLIADEGVSFRFRRDPAEAKTDFFASEDRWCRPVMARTGPDGALWVVDMYRYMIEHPEWLPKHGQDELRPWFRSGDDRGRIYRIVRSDRPARKVPRLAELSPKQLVAALESSNGGQRDMAQRLLVRGKHRETSQSLQELASKSKQPLARLHALWTLEGLGTLSASTLESALADSHAGVRRNAVRIASRVMVDPSKIARLADDPNVKVRLELATTLGSYDDPATSTALAKLAKGSNGEPYRTAAVMSSLNRKNVSTILAAVVQSSGRANGPVMLEVMGQAVAMGETDAIGRVIEVICSPQGKYPEKVQFDSLARILDGLAKRNLPVNKLSQPAVERIAETIQRARVAAGNQAAKDELRARSIQLLGRQASRRESDFGLMQRMLVPQSSVVLQQAVVSHLSRRSEPSVAEVLLSGWGPHSPQLRSQILDVLASRKPWAESLRQRLQAGTIRASELSAPLKQRLLANSKNAPQWQKALAAKVSTSRAEVLRQFQPVLQLEGDNKRGAVVFRKLCINCHKVKNEGHEVGPLLASVTNKTKAALLASILAPNAAVEAKYLSYSIVTDDGRIVSGRLETETGSSITLLAAGGKRETVLRRDIEELRASTKSLMPEGLEQGLKPQDLADLIQFVSDTYR
ncbi:MAG: c-type cytochrome [Mariniblastus sp.]|nr:c-type cytochrome [Mariniblastus sp.]